MLATPAVVTKSDDMFSMGNFEHKVSTCSHTFNFLASYKFQLWRFRTDAHPDTTSLWRRFVIAIGVRIIAPGGIRDSKSSGTSSSPKCFS